MPATIPSPPDCFPLSAVHVPAVGNALYIVATPIGNLSDMSYRAVATLQRVDVIFCEDTRTSAQLLSTFAIGTKTLPYHDYNGHIQRPKILRMLNHGKAVALISDAGTPLVSDPGYKLVDSVIESGHKVVPVPGASAPMTALMAAGLPSDMFTYRGFLPNKIAAKHKVLRTLTPEQGTIIFFDTPRRLGDTLRILQRDLPDCTVVVARELTKKFEQFVRITARDITEDIIVSIPTKGECVLLLRLPKRSTSKKSEDIPVLLQHHMQTLSLSDAVKQVVHITGENKKSVYKYALQIKNGAAE